MSDKVRTMVGHSVIDVDQDLFLDTHTRLADEFRARGLAGTELDHAIVSALPSALAEALGGGGGETIQ